MPEHGHNDAVLAAILAFLDASREKVTITIRAEDGAEAQFVRPAKPKPPSGDQCRDAVLEAIEKANARGVRPSMSEIRTALRDKFGEDCWSERTIDNRVFAMQEEGLIANDYHAKGEKGYYLTEGR